MVLRTASRPLSAALAIVALSAAPLWGGDAGRDDDREALVKAFRQLGKQAEAASVKAPTFGPDDPVPTFVEEVEEVRTPYGPARNIIMVWAELDDKAHTKVSLDGYRWKPLEKFHLVVLSSIPVQFALHNCTPAGKLLDRIVPSSDHPKLFDGLINPLTEDGYQRPTPFVVPVPLCMFNSPDDEAILLTATVEGMHEDRGPAQVFSAKEMDAKANGSDPAVGTFKQVVSEAVKSKDGGTDVATVLLSERAEAKKVLVMHKKKD